MMTEEGPDGVSSPSGSVHSGGFGTADREPGEVSRVDDHESGCFDGGDFVVDHDADPPEEVQPTTTS